MKRLKIGILGTRGIPNNYGGFEQFAQWLSLGLLQRGHEVYVYSSTQHTYKEKEWNGVYIIHCSDKEHKIGAAGQFFYDWNCISDARKRDYDILLHFGYTSDSIWYRRWPRHAINIVNMDGMEWKRAKYNKLTRRFLKWAESLAAKNAQALIADSPGIQDHLLNSYGRRSVYIPYGAQVFEKPVPSVPANYHLQDGHYFLIIARMEPENNIEMIIRGYLDSGHTYPLLIIGNTTNKYGKYLSHQYQHPLVKFAGPVYDQEVVNNLRYYSSLYFHGHSVGGTNPSLLEAMACGCTIAAHNNIFNHAVLQNDADYFSTAGEVTAIITREREPAISERRKQANLEKIKTIYNPEKIIGAYEELMLHSCCK